MSTGESFNVTQWLNFVQFWLLPSTCVVCGAPGQPRLDLCPRCANELPTIASPCLRCGLPLPADCCESSCGSCLQEGNPITRTLAALSYQHPVDKLIAHFKYHRKLQCGRVLTHLLRQQVQQSYRPEALPELLIPIPLHHAKIRQRGYNQAQLIARDLSKSLQIPLAHDLVQRCRETPAQQGLRARERKRNLRGAFVASGAWQTTRCQRIALVDDVVTTMSTVREVARVLQHGRTAKLEIHVWCLARA